MTYEAKYKNKPLTNLQIQQEIQQSNGSGLSPYRYGFISKNGYDHSVLVRQDDSLILYTLDDLYQL